MAQANRDSITCTPEYLLNDAPYTKCLACLSESELLLLLLYCLMYYFDEETDLDGALDSSKCFTCMSDTQKLQAVVASVAFQILDEEITADEVRDILKCMRCAKPGQIKGGLVWYICRYMNALQAPT